MTSEAAWEQVALDAMVLNIEGRTMVGHGGLRPHCLPELVPDLWRLVAYLGEALEELEALVPQGDGGLPGRRGAQTEY